RVVEVQQVLEVQQRRAVVPGLQPGVEGGAARRGGGGLPGQGAQQIQRGRLRGPCLVDHLGGGQPRWRVHHRRGRLLLEVHDRPTPQLPELRVLRGALLTGDGREQRG